MSFLATLPAPRQEFAAPSSGHHASASTTSQALRAANEPPPYGSRAGWVPRKLADYGEGGRGHLPAHAAQRTLARPTAAARGSA